MRLLPLVLLPSILPSNTSCSIPSCHNTRPIHLCLWYHIAFKIFLSSWTTGKFLICLLVLPTDFLHPSPDPHFKGLLLSACVNVHVSAAYTVMLQTKHFIICFFNSKFNLPVNSLFLSMNIVFPNAILLWISYSQYPSVLCPDVWTCSPVQQTVYQLESSFYNFPYGLCTWPSFLSLLFLSLPFLPQWTGSGSIILGKFLKFNMQFGDFWCTLVTNMWLSSFNNFLSTSWLAAPLHMRLSGINHQSSRYQHTPLRLYANIHWCIQVYSAKCKHK